ncbi:DUF3021 family protein [Brochothrix thermosphacta]|uniref:DUF3021 domain-containing protein n=1 Tax=Brochothrix thermosphacta TaxID=2756 RepID=A0A2X0QEK6_BROTH|nr:DUF3021 family protein [Brochothrix thermosphacta]ANZ94774.1 hypothetical protein BFC19_04845 [Brochothrix thermosphacta]ODJ51118.1 hypothetical protein BFR34_01695 [Brochothrix thermosphacta DSM 20171 = FSL F6-1036]ODJ58342.1 hypothetical protein BFR44_09285 [Brochothrix thermosphacta]SPN75501.1 conserved membrane hypothetical protein [Brochothrix thermosphacta]SPP25520.1 conserved membrane hypothetical protein [Brochothrix thermosphacta]
MDLYKRIVAGLGIGSFVYLVSLYFNGVTEVTPKTIITVFLISIFSGVATIVFDIERLSFLMSLLIHFIVTTLFIFLLYGGDYQPKHLYALFTSIVIIYVGSYSLVITHYKITARKINKLLSKIKQSH